ncbi:putative short-chain dehydrogenase/reductase [Nocardia neocaledoniensis NBRC 108232]|uniref:Short-subunit dehydrogenase n=1 Tax=Nocardia neocaledoniensis TaxID=236511 RepID=A0A317N7N2_9NOCA|nr:SDR family oxidoreductase [Nocardia neocaledoniensis]PWV71064.1 short-subunit dehydrogenase [Nocardia neocaledoniensis]GEM30267.1 putative short-chain dehydrogenase/reductase [Nocardia neocaledoniensis NBRC 108232]
MHSVGNAGGQRTAVVTGASSGIGREVARALVARGYRVVGTSRSPESVPDSARIDGVELRALDLTDPRSIARFAESLDVVDVVVNNAGESQSGPFEELPADAVRRLFELNVFGPVALTQALLPGMRSRGYGRVVMIGSMLASFPLPFRSSYVASKTAIKAFADAARFELSPHGVWLSTVEPGSIRTGISERRTKYLAADSVFAADFATVIGRLDANERRGIPAERVAATVLRAIEAERPRPLYAVGSRAPLAFTARRLLTGTAMATRVARAHGLTR